MKNSIKDQTIKNATYDNHNRQHLDQLKKQNERLSQSLAQAEEREKELRCLKDHFTKKKQNFDKHFKYIQTLEQEIAGGLEKGKKEDKQQ